MSEPACTCHRVPVQYHTTHYGATEPGSMLEPDYDCPAHFPKRKRKWGDAPARIVFGGDDDHEMWTWECRMRGHVPGARTFGDVLTFRDAVITLVAHQWWHHTVDARRWIARNRT